MAAPTFSRAHHQQALHHTKGRNRKETPVTQRRQQTNTDLPNVLGNECSRLHRLCRVGCLSRGVTSPAGRGQVEV